LGANLNKRFEASSVTSSFVRADRRVEISVL
jgi:hypothetical protein